MMMTDIGPGVHRAAGDVMASGAVLASFMMWLPPVSALLGVIWFAIQIVESRTMARIWRACRRTIRVRAHARATTRLQKAAARLKLLEAAEEAALLLERQEHPARPN